MNYRKETIENIMSNFDLQMKDAEAFFEDMQTEKTREIEDCARLEIEQAQREIEEMEQLFAENDWEALARMAVERTKGRLWK
jgi:hypothetical protein